MPARKRILVVEDDRALARVLRDNLTFDGFDVDWVANGALAESKVSALNPDLVVLDITLPGRDGFEICGALRQRGRVPILMLTARGQKTDKLKGLDLGADDYMTKPFDLEEFLARVRAVLRRTRPSYDALTLGTVTVDFISQTAYRGGHNLHLTHREFEILSIWRSARGWWWKGLCCSAKCGAINRRRSRAWLTTRSRGSVRRSSPTSISHNSFTPSAVMATR
jgi:DNA-binding response OmpR family regulator